MDIGIALSFMLSNEILRFLDEIKRPIFKV